jgi:hypothetical protein
MYRRNWTFQRPSQLRSSATDTLGIHYCSCMYTNQTLLVRTHVDLLAVKCKQTHFSTIQLQSDCRYTPVCKYIYIYIYLKQGNHCSFCAVYMLLSLAAKPTFCDLNVVWLLLSTFCSMLVSGPVSRSVWYHYLLLCSPCILLISTAVISMLWSGYQDIRSVSMQS